MGRLFSTSAILQDEAEGTGNGELFDCSGLSTLGLEISGTFTGTLTFQGRLAGGTWTPIQAENLQSGVIGTTSTVVGLFRVPIAGLDEFRVRVAWTSGTSVTVKVTGTIAASGTTLADVDIVAGEQVDIGDVSKGTQTNDVKVTLDTEVVVLGAGTAEIGKLAAGDANIGNVDIVTSAVEKVVKTFSFTPTILAETYASKSLIADKETLTDAVRSSGGGGRIKTVTIGDLAYQKKAMDVIFFNADTTDTTWTKDVMFDIGDADLPRILGIVNIDADDWASFKDNSVVCKEVDIAFCASGSADIYVALVARYTTTYASTSDLNLHVTIIQD